MNLDELLQIPDAQRNSQWENQFFQALTTGQLKLLSPEPITGPDNWPYLLAETTNDGTEPTSSVIRWLAERGIGLAINPQKEYPDYVFTYGMLWSFKETGFFYKEAPSDQSRSWTLEPDQKVQAGPPTDEYLPGYVRKVLQDFFRDQGILKPRILMLSQDQKNYDLAFSLESLGNPPEAEHDGIAEAIGWFLPPHYSLVLVSENGLPSFYDL